MGKINKQVHQEGINESSSKSDSKSASKSTLGGGKSQCDFYLSPRIHEPTAPRSRIHGSVAPWRGQNSQTPPERSTQKRALWGPGGSIRHSAVPTLSVPSEQRKRTRGHVDMLVTCRFVGHVTRRLLFWCNNISQRYLKDVRSESTQITYNP